MGRHRRQSDRLRQLADILDELEDLFEGDGFGLGSARTESDKGERDGGEEETDEGEGEGQAEGDDEGELEEGAGDDDEAGPADRPPGKRKAKPRGSGSRSR